MPKALSLLFPFVYDMAAETVGNVCSTGLYKVSHTHPHCNGVHRVRGQGNNFVECQTGGSYSSASV